ncbi:MAG: hypothetical protein J6V28_01595 [Tidjanibacter sp.]|nr:hypothetical protein [Tidjanibacter sp.]
MKRFFTFSLALCCALVAVEVSAQRHHHRHDSPLKGQTTSTTDINQYGQTVSVVPLSAEAQEGFLVFQNKKADYKVWFDVRVQTDGALFWGAPEGADKIGNGVSIRRARLAIKGQLRKDWYGELDMDLANGVLELKDAYMRFDGIPNVQLQVGNFKESFSISNNTTSRYLQFIERPMAVAFAPSRHIGLQAKWEIPVVWAAVGAFCQPVEGEEARVNVEDNNKDYGRSSGYSFTGKVVVRPLFELHDASLHLGFATSYRTPKSDFSPSKYGSARISSRNSTSINRKKYLDTGNIPDVNFEMLYSVEMAAHYKGLRCEAAFLRDDVHINEHVADSPTKRFWGAYAQAGVLLFGGEQHYDAGGAEYTRITPGRSWGDIELCARFDRLDLDSEDVRGGAANGWTFGVNYWINSNIKMMLNYQYVANNKWANGNGKLIVGYNSNGEPTTDPSAVNSSYGDVGVSYSMMACRFEVNF